MSTNENNANQRDLKQRKYQKINYETRKSLIAEI